MKWVKKQLPDVDNEARYFFNLSYIYSPFLIGLLCFKVSIYYVRRSYAVLSI